MPYLHDLVAKGTERLGVPLHEPMEQSEGYLTVCLRQALHMHSVHEPGGQLRDLLGAEGGLGRAPGGAMDEVEASSQGSSD